MADDGNGENELARLRRRQQPDDKAEVATSESAPSTAPPDGDGDPTVDGNAMDSLEQRVLGAVRQAVTDVMQDGKQPADLPIIDMDFVAEPGTPAGAKGARHESINLMADNLSANKPISQPEDFDAPIGASRALTLAIAFASLGFIVLVALFTLRGNDRDQLSLAAVDPTDRPVAGATSQSEVARLSSSDPAASPSSPQDALISKEPLEPAETQSMIRLLAKENAEREEIERKRLKIEEVERLRLEAKRVVEENAQRETIEQERLEKDEAERQRLAVKRIAEEKAQREATERERLEKEEAERQRLAVKRIAEEKAQREATERKRIEKEEAERKRREAKRIAEEKAQREAIERERLEKEEAERQRRAAKRIAEEKAQREATERKRLEKEEAERQRLAAKRVAEEKAQREAAERERLEKEQAERQRRAAKRIAEEKAQREAAERERIEKEQAERQRLAAERVAKEKAQREAAERERIEKEETERQRRAAKRIAEEKAQREVAERERLRKDKAERKRLALLRAAVEKARDEVTQRKRQLEAQDERLRIASLRETQKEAQRKVAERKQQEALAAERAVLPKSLAETGVRDTRKIEDLAAEAKKRLQSEQVLAERLTSILKDAKQARGRSNSPPSSKEELPLAWTVEEKVRLKLEELLNEINKEEKVAAAPHLRGGPTLVRKRVTLQLKESNLKITGVLKSKDTSNYIIVLPSNELMTLPIEHFDCISSGCPPKSNE